MMRALWLKEWRAHRAVVLMCWTTVLLSFISILVWIRNSGNEFEAFRIVTTRMGIILTFALVNRLVVTEYKGQTQSFLETLPVTRLAVVSAKWLLGLMLLLIPLAICFATAYYVARSHSVITASQTQWMLLRCFSFAIFAYSLVFAVAFSGRYRFLVWALLFFAAIFVDEMGQLPPERWPPLHLVFADGVVYPHNAVPWSAIAITWLSTAALIFATLLITLSKEGSIITGLYARMSHQEKVILVLLGLTIVAVISQIEERKPKAPFQLQQAVHSHDGLPAVNVQLNASISEERAEKISNELAGTLKEIQDYIGLSESPVVSVIPDSSLDSDVFMLASTAGNDGVVVRAAINDVNFDRTQFDAFVIQQVFEWYSNGQGIPEDQQWLLDGFIQWWLNRRDDQLKLIALRSVVADQQYPLQTAMLDQWMTSRERMGACLSDATAWRMVTQLTKTLNASAFRNLMQKLFAKRPVSDVRYWIQKPDTRDALVNAGVTLSQIIDMAQRQIPTNEFSHQADIENVHRLNVAFSANIMRGKNMEVQYKVENGYNSMFSIRYKELGPWHGKLQLTDLARVDTSSSGVLPATMQRGSLIFTAIEQYDDALHCTLRSNARRWEVQ